MRQPASDKGVCRQRRMSGATCRYSILLFGRLPMVTLWFSRECSLICNVRFVMPFADTTLSARWPLFSLTAMPSCVCTMPMLLQFASIA